jgi:cytoskeletal protein RodZ
MPVMISDTVWTLGYYAVIVFGILIAIGLFVSKDTQNPPPLNARAIKPAPQSKPVVPVVQPKSLAPKITKVEVPVVTVEAPKAEPVLEPKSLPIVAEEKKEEIINVAPVEAVAPVEPVAPTVKSSIDDTFEAYRQAMLASGPRQMEEEARAELQSKNGAANSSVWREQTTTLRQSLKDETAAAFLERTNTSINDRMVAIFDAVKA